MNQDDKLGALLKRYDPFQTDYAQLDRIENRILALALRTPQDAGDFDGVWPLSGQSLVRWAGMACMLMFLGLWTGQSLFAEDTVSQQDLASMAWSMPWQEIAQN
jgi:hypothetical protein